MRETAALVRIWTSAPRAASAMARASAPGPPLTMTLLPPGAASIAAFRSNTAPLPADQGPIAVPNTPRDATAAWRRSVSNHSLTRSAAAMGPHRSSLKLSVRPRARKRFPTFSISHISPAAGASIDGGVKSNSPDRKTPRRLSVSQNSG